MANGLCKQLAETLEALEETQETRTGLQERIMRQKLVKSSECIQPDPFLSQKDYLF